MTYKDIIIMRRNLDFVEQTKEADPKFLYAVSKMKRRADSIIETLNSIKKPSEKIEEYWKKFDELNKKFAEKDDTGTVIYTTIPVGGQQRKAFKKVIGEGNPNSNYEHECDALKDEYKNDIDIQESKNKKYNEMLDVVVPKDEFRLHMIDIDIVPNGIHPLAMDGIIWFIKEDEQEVNKEVKKENKK